MQAHYEVPGTDAEGKAVTRTYDFVPEEVGWLLVHTGLQWAGDCCCKLVCGGRMALLVGHVDGAHLQICA